MTVTASSPRIDFAAQRQIMVDRQIRTFDITDSVLLDLMLETPRELFLPQRLAPIAYSDVALEVGRGGAGEMRRLLTPMILARMLQAARVRPQDRTLDVAGGGGYGAVLLARLGASVLAVENSEELTVRAEAGFKTLGLANARGATGALANAADAAGPFDAIIVNGAVESAPERLLSLLADGGRLVAIHRSDGDPTGFAACATLWERSQDRFGRLPLFNAAAPVLPGFARPHAFSF